MAYNIISNCCLGAFITRDLLRSEYTNPFVWSWITASDIISIMNDYNNIRWNNFRIATYNNLPLQDGVVFSVSVDDKIILTYSHYQFMSKCDTVVVDRDRNMVYYNKIWEYVVNKYINRVNRMFSNNQRPVFILLDDFTEKRFTEQQIQHILTYSTYPTMLFTHRQNNYHTSELTKVCTVDPNDMLPEHISDKYQDDIKHFLYLSSVY